MNQRKRKGRRQTTRRARLVAEALREHDHQVSHQWVVEQVKELWPTALTEAGEGPGKFERAKLRLIELVEERVR